MYQPPRKLAHGDIITAEDWNTLVETADKAHHKAHTPTQASPGIIGLAILAASASASQVPLSRRSLLRFWKRA